MQLRLRFCERPMVCPAKSGFGPRLHAWVMAHAGPRYDKLVRERKRKLFAGVAGDVLEIGPGTGPNLKYYTKGTRWIGVEPNQHMNKHLAKAIHNVRLTAEVRYGWAEHLPVADASQDVVVSTLVLCSVEDPRKVLAEILRVLRPNGRFIFMEHVAAAPGTILRRIQRWLCPISLRLADGCHPDRETWKMIEEAGFADVEIEHFRLPLGHVSPQICGSAIRGKD